MSSRSAELEHPVNVLAYPTASPRLGLLHDLHGDIPESALEPCELQGVRALADALDDRLPLTEQTGSSDLSGV